MRTDMVHAKGMMNRLAYPWWRTSNNKI